MKIVLGFKFLDLNRSEISNMLSFLPAEDAGHCECLGQGLGALEEDVSTVYGHRTTGTTLQ